MNQLYPSACFRYPAKVQTDLQNLDAEISHALSNLDPQQMQATPTSHPEKWTIQQIVEHLLLTYQRTLPALQARLDKGTPTRATPSLLQRAAQLSIFSFRYFPPGRPAPLSVTPPPSEIPRSGHEVSRQVSVDLAQLEAMLSKAELLFGSRRAASHMTLGPLSMAQWRRFHLVHGRHHLKQIQAIRRDHQF